MPNSGIYIYLCLTPCIVHKPNFYSRAGVSKLWPMGHVQPTLPFYLARSIQPMHAHRGTGGRVCGCLGGREGGGHLGGIHVGFGACEQAGVRVCVGACM